MNPMLSIYVPELGQVKIVTIQLKTFAHRQELELVGVDPIGRRILISAMQLQTYLDASNACPF
jgi:hypothetical protein